MHLPALVLVEHSAFWPLLFTATGKQPLRVSPAYAKIAANGEGQVPSYQMLVAAEKGDSLPPDAPYLRHWPQNYDYVLLLYAGKLPAKDRPLLPERLVLLREGDIAALYRVRGSALQ